MSRIGIGLLVVWLLSYSSLYSQHKIRVSGTVIDSVQQTPLELATVSIFQQGATRPFDGTSTDKKGNFVLTNLTAGEYRLTIEFLDHQAVSIANFIVANNASVLSLGTILLSPVHKQLQEVTITAKAPIIQNKIDKLVYNTEADLTSQGGVALDVLNNLPVYF